MTEDDQTVVEFIACGAPPSEYDAKAKSKDGRCPHCGARKLEPGYGLGAGGCGSYNFCLHCSRFCDAVEDEG